MMKVKFPEVEVQLSGEDGNAYAIMGAVQKAMRKAEIPQHEIEAYLTRSMSSQSYDELLQVAIATVTVR
jgi:hypothetical protein